jgi:hypothetical protein
LEARSDLQPQQRGLSDCLEAWSDRLVQPWSYWGWGGLTAWGGSWIANLCLPKGAVRPCEGAVRPPVVVAGVPALRLVPMGESIGSISDKNS